MLSARSASRLSGKASWRRKNTIKNSPNAAVATAPANSTERAASKACPLTLSPATAEMPTMGSAAFKMDLQDA